MVADRAGMEGMGRKMERTGWERRVKEWTGSDWP